MYDKLLRNPLRLSLSRHARLTSQSQRSGGLRASFLLLLLLVLLAVTSAQAQSGDTLSQRQATLDTYQAKQAALTQERQALIASGATRDQLQAWRQQNASRFSSQQRRAQRLATLSALDPLPVVTPATIPVGASRRLAELLTTGMSLASAHAQLHNQWLQSLSADPPAEQIAQMQQQIAQLFQQQHPAELALRSQQAQALAQDSAGQAVIALPPLQVPVGATPPLTTFLAARDQLTRERIQVHNQYATADPTTRQTALQQWRQQNASRFQQLQQMAQALSQNN